MSSWRYWKKRISLLGAGASTWSALALSTTGALVGTGAGRLGGWGTLALLASAGGAARAWLSGIGTVAGHCESCDCVCCNFFVNEDEDGNGNGNGWTDDHVRSWLHFYSFDCATSAGGALEKKSKSYASTMRAQQKNLSATHQQNKLERSRSLCCLLLLVIGPERASRW